MAVPVSVFIVVATGFVLNFTPVESQEWHSRNHPETKKKFYIDTFQRVNWHAAFFRCMRNNSLLANVESADEKQEVINLIEDAGVSDQEIWLGGNDLANEGLWTWSQGQEMKGFTNWAGGEPNNFNGSQNCNFMRPKSRKYEWDDHFCSETMYFVCEYRTAVTSDWPPAGAREKKFHLELRMNTDWFSAYMHCLRNNSRLARIENKEENDIVVDMIKQANLGVGTKYWLGAMDFPEVGQYFWLSSGLRVRGYSNWHAGEGMAEDQRCLAYWQSSQYVVKWDDFICTTLYPFVCEYYE